MNNTLKNIPYNTQYIDNEDIKAVVNLLESGEFLTCGKKIVEFEKTICKYTGSKYAVAVSNGTAALHIACLALGIGKNDEVIVPAITFAASANSVLYTGAKPIFCDIDEETLNIDCDKIENLITKNTKAIIAVDMGGQICDYHKLKEICIKYNLFLIEDAAHSFGARELRCPIKPCVGSFADITTFSFHPVKNITTGEGGMVTTNNLDLYNLLKKLRSHGLSKSFIDRENTDNKGYEYDIELLGYNYRLTDIQAVLGISQMNKIHKFMEKREELKNYYLDKLSNNNKIECLKYKFNSANHLFIIKIKNGKRDKVYEYLKKNGIYTNVHYKPVYMFSLYKKLGYNEGICPNAEKIYKEILSVPIYYKLSKNDIDKIVKLINIAIN